MIKDISTSRSANRSLRSSLRERDRVRRASHKDFARVAGAKFPKRNDLSPKLHLIESDPNTLIAPKRNVRSLSPEHIRAVANSISMVGFVDPVLIDQDGSVIDGLVRVEAAKLLNLPTVPCVVCDTLTKTELKLLRIAVNRLGEKGEWALDNLKSELEELIIEEVPIEVSGFEMVEIDAIFADIEPAQVEPGPIQPVYEKAPIARHGDVFLLGRHRVVCGDATDPSVMSSLMKGAQAQMLCTDQPYNVPIVGNVTSGAHREFEMGSGEIGRPPSSGPVFLLVHRRPERERWGGRRSWSGLRSRPYYTFG